MSTFVILYAVIMVLLVCALPVIYLVIRTKKKKVLSDINLSSSKKNVKNRLYQLQKIYMVTPIVKRYFVKLKNKYRAIFPADEVTLNKKTTSRITICLSICIAIFAATCILANGDVMFAVAGFLSCYIIFTTLVNSSEEKLQIKLLEQLDTFITDVHSYYHDTGMVDEAIASTLDDLPYEISLHANKIYNIVTSVDSEAEIEKYVDTAPNKFLLLMAAICVSVKEYGDEKVENGRSLFLKNLNYLKSELSQERLRMQKRVAVFSGKVIGVLVPLFCLKPLEMWMRKNFADTVDFYQGFGGTFSLACIIAVTFVCYELINALKDDRTEHDEPKIYRTISEIPAVKNILKLYTEKNYTKTMRYGDALKAIGVRSGTNVFFVKRICTALLLFIISLAVFFTGVYKAKDIVLTSYSQSYEDSLVPNEEWRETLRETSIKFKGSVKSNKVDKEQLIEELKSQLDGDERMATLVYEELESRREAYENKYFKWYMFVISLAVGIFGFFLPVWLLYYKKKIMGMNREDEVAQFRTLILILMHEDGMNIDIILEWMERFSHAFKSSISDCIINLEYSQQGALETLREKEGSFGPFRRLCDSLLSADKVGVDGAFDDLETEREYYQEKRKLDNDKLLGICLRKANRYQMIPIWCIIIFYLILPFGMYALNMLTEFGTLL